MIEIAYWKMRCLVGGIRVLLEYADAGKIFTDCSGLNRFLKTLVEMESKTQSKIGKRYTMKAT